ncbi:MAG: DUF4846 domain-containing protein [Polyangiaceae bacterium]
MSLSTMKRACLFLGVLSLVSGGCASAPENTPGPSRQALSATAALPSGSAGNGGISVTPAMDSPRPGPPTKDGKGPVDESWVDVAAYPWLHDRTIAEQTIDGKVQSRFPAPSGWTRAPLQAGSFGAWLRGLPLRPKSPVRDYRGRELLRADDSRIAAVAALDEGAADLQQCADSVIRLHAEWRWSRGDRDESYRAASGAEMPFGRWLAGSRPVVEDGKRLTWKLEAKRGDRDDHGSFRRFLDAVFMWANTGSLARDGKRVALAELRPGDFFVLPGGPGHTVLVLDAATSASGQIAVLLGQGYMPAQSFHVLRGANGSPWFTLDPSAEGVDTPFWPAPFPWSSLRRLD